MKEQSTSVSHIVLEPGWELQQLLVKQGNVSTVAWLHDCQSKAHRLRKKKINSSACVKEKKQQGRSFQTSEGGGEERDLAGLYGSQNIWGRRKRHI